MSTYISETLRNIVIERANHTCEYCLISQEDTFHSCHIDHIISIKHGGATSSTNLALACSICNRNKGSDVGSYLFTSDDFARFFNPRKDDWKEHFYLKKGMILSKTKIGEATVKILDFNNEELVLDRQSLIKTKRYPPS